MIKKKTWNHCSWVLILLMIGMFPHVGDAAGVHSQVRGNEYDILITAPTERGHKDLALNDPPASVCVKGWFRPSVFTVRAQIATINADVQAVLAGRPGFRISGGEVDAGQELLRDANYYLSRKELKADDFWSYHELTSEKAGPGSGIKIRTPLNPPPGATEIGISRDCYTLAELEQMKKQALHWAKFMKNNFLPKHGVN